MNDIIWDMVYVPNNSKLLVDRTGNKVLATTDPVTKNVYLNTSLQYNKDLLRKVIIHELGHCAIISYNLTDDIYKMVKPEYRIEAEEFICNFIAEYGLKITRISNELLKLDLVKSRFN